MRILWPLINAAQAVYTVVWSAGWITVALVVSALRRSPAPGLALARHVWGPGLLRAGGAQLQVEGREGLDPSRAYFFAANHQSWMDIPALFAALPMPVLFLAKRELAAVPFLGRYIEKMGMVFVDRSERRQTARTVGDAAGRLREGWSILSFPEGTRTFDGRVQRFKTASFAAAIDAGVPVVPVALEGAGRVLPRGGFRARPGLIRICIGEPIPTAGLTRDARGELAERAQREVERLLEGLTARAEPSCPLKPHPLTPSPAELERGDDP
ncbi:MAG TPA: lysophospholipid acyltransferase family protein [Thermoanaerobaculia bacterium]|nr:lysophospholipid acyltransferase family protein [Thermoanaerobaculia bacterium]